MEGDRVFQWQYERDVCCKLLCISCKETTAGHEAPKTSIEADPAQSLLHVSKALFPLVLNCVVFSLGLLTPTFSGQKSSSGLDGKGVWGRGEIHLHV